MRLRYFARSRIAAKSIGQRTVIDFRVAGKLFRGQGYIDYISIRVKGDRI